MIVLYHGSNVEIQEISLSFSRRGKDFGKGFYANPDYQQAKDMAERVTRVRQQGTPTVNTFLLNENALQNSSLNIKRFEDYTTEWLEFVLMNRNNLSDTPIHPYDIVIGPIANDTVGVSLSLYIDGFASAEETIKRLRFQGSRAIQYFFATERAVSLLKKQQS